MSPRYSIHVAREHLVFCSAHFISFAGHQCERLHGHNYRASVEVAGPLDENYYVFDFLALKAMAGNLARELDHYMLLPTRNRVIEVRETGAEVLVQYRDRRWIFPRGDCVLLPIENTTAELLAAWIGQRLREEMRQQHGFQPEALRVEVEEGPGQSARVEWLKEHV